MHILLLVKDFAEGTEFNKDGLPTKSGAESCFAIDKKRS